MSVAPLFPFAAEFPGDAAADDGDDVDEIDGFSRFAVDLSLVSGTVLFAATNSGFSPTRTLHAGFDHVKTFDPNLFGGGGCCCQDFFGIAFFVVVVLFLPS